MAALAQTAGKPSEAEIARRRAAKASAPPKAPKAPAAAPDAAAAAASAAAAAAAQFDALRAFGADVGEVVDVGCNLLARGSDEDVSRQLDRAAAAGVSRIVLTGCDVAGSEKGLAFCERWLDDAPLADVPLGNGIARAKVYCTAGVHPHDASSFDAGTLSQLEVIASHALCVAVGECGLDYDRMFSPREAQLFAFEAQARLAKKLRLPVFAHVRERDEGEPLGAYADAVAILTAVGLAPRDVLVHCFTGNAAELESVQRFGARLGFTGYVGIAKRNSATIAALRGAGVGIEALQSGELVIETDSPFMSPDKTYLPTATAKQLGLRGGANEPCVLPAVARALGDALRVPAADVARLTTAAAVEFFRLEDADARARAPRT
ncbi:hypothetical protein M885DRAFT_505247 [Pelagophyceae sp. CCMP2097]|nr:hypothetical protein M885DRAFT_505247 [Pelagophyceae sp. CCMP2097]